MIWNRPVMPGLPARQQQRLNLPSRRVAGLAVLLLTTVGLVAAGPGRAFAAAPTPAVNVFVTNGLRSVQEEPAGGGALQTVATDTDGRPDAIAIGANGNLYYTDGPANEVLEVPAGSSTPVVLPITGLNDPLAIAVTNSEAGFGTLYITDQTGDIITYLPNGGGEHITAADLALPGGAAVSPSGILYVSDGANVLSDGDVVASGLGFAAGLATDSAGDLFIADKDRNSIVEVAAGSGQQSTVVTGLGQPTGVAVDGDGNLYISQAEGAQLIEVPAGTSTQVVLSGLAGDGVPIGVAVPPVTQLITFTSTAPAGPAVGSTYQVAATGSLSGIPVTFTIASGSSSVCSVTGSTVTFTSIGGCQIDASEAASGALYAPAAGTQLVDVGVASLVPPVSLYVSDSANARVLELPAGGGAQVVLPATGLSLPSAVAVDAAGDVYIADSLNGQVVELPAGGGAQVTAASGLSVPSGLALDPAGDLYIGNNFASDVLKVPAGGGTPVVVPATGLSFPGGVALDGAGDLFISDSGNERIVELPAGGGAQVTVASGLPDVGGIAVDAAGDLFYTRLSAGTVTELPAGGGAPKILASGLIDPAGLAVDNVGDVFVALELQNQVLEIAAGGQLSVGGAGLRDPNAVAIAPPVAQPVRFTSAVPQTAVVGSSSTITATGGGSGNPVTFSVDIASSFNACSLSGSTVSFTGAGLCVIDANQAAAAGYLAGSASQSIPVGQGTIPITVSGSQTYGSSAPAFTYTPALPPGVTVSGSLTCDTADGGVPVSAALSGGSYTIDGASCSGLSVSDPVDYILAYSGAANQFVVTPATQSVTWTALPQAGYGQAPFSIAADAGSTSGGPLTFFAAGPCTVTAAGVVTPTGSGQCVLTAAQAGDADFGPAQGSATLVISAAGLSASASGVQAEQPVVLTAQVASDVSASKSKLVIIDQGTNAVVKSCSTGTSCSYKATNPASMHSYVAELVTAAGTVTATSPVVPVVWAAPTVTIAASPASPAAGQKVTITGTASESVSSSPLSIEIYDPATDAVLASCANGTSCSLHTAEPGGTGTFAAAILDAGVQVQLGQPPQVSVSWPAVTVTLTTSASTPAAGSAVTLTATASANVGPTGDDILIVNVTDPSAPQVLAALATGTRSKLSVTMASPGGQTYVAEIADPTGTEVENTSSPVTVTWH
jgi:hypothetical protein